MGERSIQLTDCPSGHHLTLMSADLTQVIGHTIHGRLLFMSGPYLIQLWTCGLLITECATVAYHEQRPVSFER